MAPSREIKIFKDIILLIELILYFLRFQENWPWKLALSTEVIAQVKLLMLR